MKWFKVNGGTLESTEMGKLSVSQLHQTAAIADCIGRLIPQEGVDYDIHIILREPTAEEKQQHKTPTKVSMQIIPLTDKGTWWKQYVGQMMRKYPPTTTYHADVLPDGQAAKQEEEK